MSTPTDHAARALGTSRMLGPAAALAGVIGAWAAVAVVRLGDNGPTPCPLRTTTGIDCPFCGATRAASSLAQGDVVLALDHNAFFVLVILPLAVVAWGVWATRSWRRQRMPLITNRTVALLMAITAGWWVLRLAVPWLGSTAG